MSRMVNKETFVQKALEVHGDRYNYHKVVYEKSDIKVEVGYMAHFFKPLTNIHKKEVVQSVQ